MTSSLLNRLSVNTFANRNLIEIPKKYINWFTIPFKYSKIKKIFDSVVTYQWLSGKICAQSYSINAL